MKRRHRHAGPLMRVALFIAASTATLALRAGTVFTTDGVLHDGDISLDNGLLVRAGKTAVKLSISSILRARFGARQSGDFQPGLVLAGGARIAGPFSSLTEPVVQFDRKHIAIPGSEVAWVVYQPLSARLAAQLPRAKTGALLPGGDFFEGAPRSGDSNTARILNPIFGPRMFDARKKEIALLVLREVRPQPSAFDVITRDGSIYPAFDVIARDATGVTLRHPLYDGLHIPVADLVEIRAGATRLTPLDSLDPPRVDPPPGREAASCFAAGKAIDGGTLKLGSRVVAAGFESVAGASLAWSLPPGAVNFLALAAPGSSTPPGQKLVFTVHADNRLMASSPPVGAGDPPVVLRCALPGGGRLTLRIEGSSGSGTWAEPVLLRR